MKTIVLIIALAGFTATGSYAQNKGCWHKQTIVQTTEAVQPVSAPAQVPVCFLTTVNNAGIEKCANPIYDNGTGVFQYENEKPYAGYYPATANKTYKEVTTKKVVWQIGPCASAKQMARTTVTRVETTTGEDQPLQPCYTYRKDNIVVQDCPNVFYDREGWMLDNSGLDVKSDNTYMGYYPKPDETNVPEPVAPENEDEDQDNDSPSTSPGDNLCFWNCD